ncbi:hypothetical protein E2493_12990 [Sphingomonas parva]|uniref:Uncharacterized protein n=1 Tax=Sphingomonas parva TaxID=2555898 RepID=A0A4Y8ZQS7_9SPHN|nr:hypothetical protein [Sphingomonas parva]TFI57817.1 hypothetical protein E2493_12990 [Sphingomonas parva]
MDKNDDQSPAGRAVSWKRSIASGLAKPIPNPQVDPTIRYVLLIPEDEPSEASPMQGFSQGMVETAHVLRLLVELPADVLEPALPRSAQVGRRVNGTAAWSWTPLAVRVLGELSVSAESPFMVILTQDPQVAKKADRWIASQRYHPLHVSASEASGRILMSKLTPSHLLDHFRAVLAQVARDEPTLERRLVTEALSKWSPREIQNFAKPVPGHNVSLPAVMALQGAGFHFADAGPFVGADPEDYVALIRMLATYVLDERSRHRSMAAFRTTPPQPDLYVTAPSLYSHFYEEGLGPSGTPDERAARDLLRILARQAGYQLHANAQIWSRIMKSPLARGIMEVRSAEIAIQVAAAGLAAAGTMAATVRVPPAVNRAQGSVRQFANHVRSEKSKPTGKLIKTFARVQERLASAVGPELTSVIERATAIKLVTDVPLEWLPIGNLPLALRKDVARITATPGNLQIGLLARSGLLHLSVEAFGEVLVIAAIDRKDPIAEVLTRSLDAWAAMYVGRISVDVTPAFSSSWS